MPLIFGKKLYLVDFGATCLIFGMKYCLMDFYQIVPMVA